MQGDASRSAVKLVENSAPAGDALPRGDRSLLLAGRTGTTAKLA
jgi:hypothetical protein